LLHYTIDMRKIGICLNVSNWNSVNNLNSNCMLFCVCWMQLKDEYFTRESIFEQQKTKCVNKFSFNAENILLAPQEAKIIKGNLSPWFVAPETQQSKIVNHGLS
jgi:hypothetical protein